MFAKEKQQLELALKALTESFREGEAEMKAAVRQLEEAVAFCEIHTSEDPELEAASAMIEASEHQWTEAKAAALRLWISDIKPYED